MLINNIYNHNGYQANIEYIEELNMFHVNIVSIRKHMVSFSCFPGEDFIKQFDDAIKYYEIHCKHRKEDPEVLIANP